MSVLYLSPEHLSAALDGRKWETRRLWDSKRLTVGKSYRILRSGEDSIMTPRVDAPAYAVVNDVWEEPLGAISPEGAKAEGGYSRSEFIQLWRELHGEFNPEAVVYVVDFDTYLEDPKI